MAEILVQFDTAIPGVDGRAYRPRVCGRILDGNRNALVEMVVAGVRKRA